MSFGTDIEKRESQSTGNGKFRKTRWFFPRPGKYTVRILQSDYVTKYTHWLNGITLECIGEEDGCPICLDNSKILAENPDNPRKVKGFNPFGKTSYVNIFDKTLVKVEPESGEENYPDINGTFPMYSYGSKKSISDVQPTPSNKVKVFSRSSGVFDTIVDYDIAIKDSTGMGITEYDLTFMVKPKLGNSIGSNLSIIPQTHLNEPLELEEELYDLEAVTINLLPNEIRELQRGVSLRDIFASRRNSEVLEKKEDFEPSEDIKSSSEKVTSKLTEEGKSFLERLKIK